MATEIYTVRCWNCLNNFEAIEAVWCSCDPKHPSKLGLDEERQQNYTERNSDNCD